MSKTPMSATRKVYFARLFGRILILLACLYQYFRDKSAFDVAFGTGFFQKPSLLHLLWGIWLVDMLHQLIPARGYISLGSQKHFLRRFKPITDKINLAGLRKHILTATSLLPLPGIFAGASTSGPNLYSRQARSC